MSNFLNIYIYIVNQFLFLLIYDILDNIKLNFFFFFNTNLIILYKQVYSTVLIFLYISIFF